MISNNKKPVKQPIIYLVDHDADALASLYSLLAPLNVDIDCFTNADCVLHHPGIGRAACMIIEADLQNIIASGIVLMESLFRQGYHIPTIILAKTSDIPTAVRAMQARAIDFIEKPYIEHLLFEEVKTVLQQSRL